MLWIEVLVYAAEGDAEWVRSLCAGASRCRVRGTVNRRWDDVEAQELARDAGLETVEWECTDDDTPATLTLFLAAPAEQLPRYSALLDGWADDNECAVYLGGDGDSAPPNDGNGSLHGA